MMKRGLRASVLLCWLFLPVLVADELSPLTSSLFEMKLVPTKVALSSSAANKLQLSIKTSLFQSVAITSGFDHVFDIDIVLQKTQWTPEDESTTMQFQAHVTFYTESVGKNKDSQPSQFSLDSLVARTFSQPSTKSGFIIQLGLSKDQSLSAIRDVLIQLVPASDTLAVASTQETGQFSTLDAVLITASSTIFLGILCVVYFQHRARERYDDDFLDMERRKIRHEASNVDLEQEASADPIDTEMTPKVDVTASMDSADDTTEEPALFMGRDSEDHVQGVQKSEASQGRAIVDDGMASPPVSPSHSVPSSSSEESPQTRCSSVPSSPVSSARTTAYLLGVSTPTAYPGDSFSFSSDLSPLTARLLRLPAMRSGNSFQDKNSARSYVSAPGKLIALHLSPASSVSSRDGARSVRSVRSARSASKLFDVVEQPCLETSSTRSSGNVTKNLAVIAEQNILAASKEFENNWEVAEKMAEEDDEESSVLDVFHVDVDQHSSVEDNQSRMSGLSAVSEWMKSIRVVGGGSVDSRTSAMSKSSAEHSSIEPKSMQGRDSGSVDHSLERSLATSIVEA